MLHTRLRPHCKEFLEKIAKLYELHVFTFGSRLYAHTIAGNYFYCIRHVKSLVMPVCVQKREVSAHVPALQVLPSKVCVSTVGLILNCTESQLMFG